MHSRTKTSILTIAMVLTLVGCGTAPRTTSSPAANSTITKTPVSDASVTGVSDNTPGTTTEPATSSGFQLKTPGYVPTQVTAAIPPPQLPAGLIFDVFRDSDNGVLVVRDEDAPGDATSAVNGQQTVGETSSSVFVQASGHHYMLTLSNVADAAGVQAKAVAALQQRGANDTVQSLIGGALANFRFTDSSSRGAATAAGYSIQYTDGKTYVTLMVNPVRSGAELAATDPIAAASFLQHDTSGEWVMEQGLSSEAPQLRWISDGFLLALSGPQQAIESLRTGVTPVNHDPVALASSEISAALSVTALVDSVSVAVGASGPVRIDKRAGVRNSLGAVCLTESSGATGCASFIAVGSLASVVVGDDWYIVGVVPAKPPTTTYHTDPALTFGTAASADVAWAVALVPQGVDAVSLHYGTEGVSAELSSVVTRPPSIG